MNPEIIVSERGKQLLAINNYKYGFQKSLKSGEKRWTCTNRKCKSFVLTLREGGSNVTITKHIQEHSHEASVGCLNRQIVSSACKRRAVEDLSEKPAKIIRRVFQENLPSTVTTSDVARFKRNMSNARRKMQRKNIEETFHFLDEVNIQTHRDEQYLLSNNRVFSCKTNIRMLDKNYTNLFSWYF